MIQEHSLLSCFCDTEGQCQEHNTQMKRLTLKQSGSVDFCLSPDTGREPADPWMGGGPAGLSTPHCLRWLPLGRCSGAGRPQLEPGSQPDSGHDDIEAPAQEFFHFFGSWPEPSLMRSYTTPRCEGKQLPGQEARESILLTSFALRNILSWVPL